MASKLPIHGLKLSTEQVLLKLPPGTGSSCREIFQQLTAAKINLTCVVLEGDPGGLTGTCCLDVEDRTQAEKILEGEGGGVKLIPEVGTLTVYPHRCRLDLLSAILGVLARSDIPLLGIASSLSALTFILPYRQLDAAVEAVRDVAQLPDNHAPFRPQFRVRQV